MKAVTLTSDPSEKKQLKARCREMMDVADRIKTSDQWVPVSAQVPAADVNHEDGQLEDQMRHISISSTGTADHKIKANSETASSSRTAPAPSRPVLMKATSSSPTVAPYSHIHRLSEPIPTRKRSKKEEIILYRASMVNGFKCPPWQENPLASEFVLGDSSEPFM